MRKLVEFEQKEIYRGTRIRYSANAFEGKINRDLMVYIASSGEINIGLICITGYSAGDFKIPLSNKCMPKGKIAIKTKWLIENFINLVDTESNIDDVYILESLDDPE